MRAAIAARETASALLRDAFAEAAAARSLADERARTLETANARLAEAEARIADLEMRRSRLTEAVVELRER